MRACWCPLAIGSMLSWFNSGCRMELPRSRRSRQSGMQRLAELPAALKNLRVLGGRQHSASASMCMVFSHFRADS